MAWSLARSISTSHKECALILGVLMAVLIDKRRNRDGVASGNRKKFLDRCKGRIKEVVKEAIESDNIKDITTKDRKISVGHDTLREPTFRNDTETGNPAIVGTGNYKFKRGHEQNLPSNKGARGGDKAGNEAKDFEFILTKQEFIDILFEEMALPNYVKKTLAGDSKPKWELSGVATEGPITRLHLLKTMLQAVGRKFATRGVYAERGKKPPFITEEDLRYKIYSPRPNPIQKAVMFAVMDVSVSMGPNELQLAKRFFLLLYLFLHKQYKEVEIRFIAHDTEARELPEELFFAVEGGGGTLVKSAMELVHKIISDDYDISTVNIYLAQVTDGDDWSLENGDEKGLVNYIQENLLPSLQYFAYLQVTRPLPTLRAAARGTLEDTLGGLYRNYKAFLVPSSKKVNIASAMDMKDIFPVLQRLFKQEKQQ